MVRNSLNDAEKTADESTSRRRFLKATGAGAIAATLAGCNLDEVTSKEFAANPYGIGGEGMAMLGFEEADHEKLENTRQVSVADFEGELTLTSHVVSYGHDAQLPDESSWNPTTSNSWSAGVLSTPEASIAGQAQNPLAKQPLSELLVGDRADQFLSLVGLESGAEWVCPPRPIDSQEGELLNQRTQIEAHVGVTETEEGLTTVTVYGTRVIVEDDDNSAVLAGVVDRRKPPDGLTPQDCRENFDEYLPDEERRSIIERLGSINDILNTIGPLDDLPRPGDLPAVPSLSFGDARLVQIAEATDMTSGSAGPISDPPIVVGMEAAAVFDFSGSNLARLPSNGVWAEINIKTKSRGTWTKKFRIPKSDVRDIANGASPAAKFHELARDGNSDTTPPVFDLIYDRATVKLIPAGSVVPYDTISWNVNTVNTPPLQVGFIHVKDPDEGHIDWGDSNGEAANYERSVNSSYEYIRRVFPGTVVAYRHDTPMEGNVRENTKNAVGVDAWDARKELNSVVQQSNFPNDGAIYHEEVTESRAETLISKFGLDVVVMILPKGTAPGNQHYYAAHGMSNTGGLFQGTKRAVGSLEAGAGSNDRWHGSVTAQEIGHYFANNPYDDGSNNPYSRTYTDNNGNTKDDRDHANSALESVGYSLNDGTFSLINDIDLRDGNFDPGNTRTSGGTVVSETHTSYMSYTGGNKWADNRITTFLINSNFNNRYSGGSSPSLSSAVGPGAGAVAGAPAYGGMDVAADGSGEESEEEEDEEVQPVFEAHGRVEDGAVVLDRSAVFDGQPIDTEDVATERRLAANDAEPVEMQLLGPDDQPLRSAIVPDRVKPTHGHETVNLVAASLPFDERGVWLLADRQGQRTRLNAIVHPLRDAVRRIPPRGFANAEESRSRLLGVLDEADAAMRERQYDRAADILQEDFVTAVEEEIVAYESLANEPTAEQMLALTERQTSHLQTIASG